MKCIEALPIQLKLGEKVVAEKKPARGIIEQSELIVAPNKEGKNCWARLNQDAEVERAKNCRLWQKFPGWTVITSTSATKVTTNEELQILAGKVIGAHWEQVTKKHSGKTTTVKRT